MIPRRTNPDRERWNRKYEQGRHDAGEPDAFLLRAHQQWIAPRFPNGGRALDVAGGRGRHALWLAHRGWEVTLVDLSEVGLAKARANAQERGVRINLVQADMSSFAPGTGEFELVIVFYYLERGALPRLAQALRPGGLMVYKTYTEADVRFTSDPAPFFLKPGELRDAFPGFSVLHYAETLADRATAELVAQKPTMPAVGQTKSHAEDPGVRGEPDHESI